MRLPGILTRNFRLKAVSAVLALVTWTVVVYANNPPDSRTVSVGVPGQPNDGLHILVSPVPPLTLRITGTREHIQAFDPSTQLTVKADFGAITRAGAQAIPLTVRNNDRDVDLESPPTTVQIDVDELTTQQVGIKPVIDPAPPPGFIPGTPRLEQDNVVVSGPKRVLQLELHAEVVIDLHAYRTNYDALLPVTLLDASNRRVTNLGVTPPNVHVTVQVSPSLTSRSVPVILTPVGTPAPGHILAGLALDPQSVVLNGPQDVLNTINSLELQVPVGGLTGNEVLSLRVATGRAGVTATPDTVTVRVTVTAQALPTPVPTPTPSPTATASPTPAPTATPTAPPPTPAPTP